jgi:hypothetical protein
MRAPVGLLLIGLCLTACSKKDPAPSNEGSPAPSSASRGGAEAASGAVRGPLPTALEAPGTNAPENDVNPRKNITPIRPPGGGLDTPSPSAQSSAGPAPKR